MASVGVAGGGPGKTSILLMANRADSGKAGAEGSAGTRPEHTQPNDLQWVSCGKPGDGIESSLIRAAKSLMTVWPNV